MNFQIPTHMQRPTQMQRDDIKSESCERPKAGLWKLLVAAVVILIALVAAIEIFGNGKSGFVSTAASTAARMETIVQ